MAEDNKTYNEESGGLFDPKNYVTKTALGGKRAPIIEAVFIRHNYGGKIAEDVTAARVKVKGLKNPILVSSGDTWPARKIDQSKPATPDNLEKAIIGPFLLGTVDNRSGIAVFNKALLKTDFPKDRLGKEGFAALNGADFTWKGISKKVNGEEKGTDVVEIFHGFVEIDEAQDAADQAVAGTQTAPAAPVVNEALLEEVKAAVLSTVKAAPNGEVPRSQLSRLVGEGFKDPATRSQALVLLLKDSTLASIPGVTFENKTLKLAGAAQVASEVAAA